jgi:hypothetical protein
MDIYWNNWYFNASSIYPFSSHVNVFSSFVFNILPPLKNWITICMCRQIQFVCWVRNLGKYIIKVVFWYFSVVLPTSTEESHYMQNQFIYNKLYSFLYSRNVKLEDTYSNRDIEKAFMDYSRSIFEEKTKPSLLLSKQVGNMYTTSLYGGLVSLLIR